MPATSVSRRGERQLLALGTLLARSGRIIESEISGTSMGNTLPAGSRIRICRLPAEEYEAGQVIAFVLGSRIFAHRIIFRTRQGVLTRGDTRTLCDLPVPLDAVLGVVTEWSVNGEWQSLEASRHCQLERPRSIQRAEMLLRGCMRIDLRLARHASRALMRLARSRHRLAALWFRTR
jgi:hypothetical protein